MQQQYAMPESQGFLRSFDQHVKAAPAGNLCERKHPMKRVALALCMIAFCGGTLAASSSTVTATGVVALSTERILDSIGINTHINYTDGAYADVSKVGDRLQWLGITHIREYTPGHSTPLSSYVYLARRGFKYA